jgi:hypothetical protein
VSCVALRGTVSSPPSAPIPSYRIPLTSYEQTESVEIATVSTRPSPLPRHKPTRSRNALSLANDPKSVHFVSTRVHAHHHVVTSLT